MATSEEEILKLLVCHECKKYISGDKLKVDHIGNTLCGNCEPECKWQNVPKFEELLKDILFPCNYVTNGCQELLLKISAGEHEENCQYKNNSPKKPFQTISLDFLNSLRCGLCNNYLNVSPIRLMENGDYICGRCPDIFVDSAPIRHKLFENVAMLIKYPCKNFQRGCKAFLSWENVEEHELFCRHLKFDCPLSLKSNCEWTGTFEDIISHNRNEHKEHFMDSSSFLVNLKEEKEIFKVFQQNGDIFLINIKVNLSKSQLILNVQQIEKYNSSDKNRYKYSVKFSERDISFQPIKEKHVEYCGIRQFFRNSEWGSIPLDKFSTIFDLAEILCDVTLSFDKDNSSESPNELFDIKTVQSFEKCSKKECDHIGGKQEIEEHEKICPNKIIWCRFCCPIKLPKDKMGSHEKMCSKRRVVCKWPECGGKYLHTNIAAHQENCPFNGKFKLEHLQKELNIVTAESKENSRLLEKEKEDNLQLKQQILNSTENRFQQNVSDDLKSLIAEKESNLTTIKTLEKQLAEEKSKTSELQKQIVLSKKEEIKHVNLIEELNKRLSTSEIVVHYITKLNKHDDKRKFECFSKCTDSKKNFLIMDLLIHLKEFHTTLVPTENEIDITSNFAGNTKKDEWFVNFCICFGELFRVRSRLTKDDQLECNIALYGPDSLVKNFKCEVLFSEDKNQNKLVGNGSCNPCNGNNNQISINAKNYFRNYSQLSIKIVIKENPILGAVFNQPQLQPHMNPLMQTSHSQSNRRGNQRGRIGSRGTPSGHFGSFGHHRSINFQPYENK